MSLLRDIQNAAIDGDSDLETLLRKCRVLAARLQNDEFKNGVDSELDGYHNKAEVPDYRHLKGQVLGHFAGFCGRQLRNAQIPELCIPEEFRDQLTTIDLRPSVSSLTDTVRNFEGDALHINWPADFYPVFGDKIYEDMNLMQAWIAIPKSAVVGILSTVRNRILSFALEIEADNPAAGEAQPDTKPIPEERVSQVFNQYIYGNVGSVASGQHITQTAQQNINKGDFAALASFLKEFGFVDEDLEDLRHAVEVEPVPTSGGFGERVTGWIETAVGKVAESGRNISIPVISRILEEAIKRYYGL